MQPSEADLRAFVGPNAEYYLQGWANVKPDGDIQRLRWNWPAFFLNIVWLLYRRMYRYFWIGFGVLVAVAIFEEVATPLLSIGTPNYVNFSLNLTIAYYFGSFGTSLYYRHAAEEIRRTKAQLFTPDAVARAGGVRLLWAVVVGLLVGIDKLGAIMLRLGAAH
jgi:hypothetical protein